MFNSDITASAALIMNAPTIGVRRASFANFTELHPHNTADAAGPV